MAPRFNKIMSKMRDEEDVPADIPNPEMYMPEPEREIARPFPPGVAAQEAFDDMLQRRVVDPLSQAGYEDMGAGLAAIPSAAHSMIVPQTDLDVAGTIIPLPGVAKLMKKGKFRKISKAMNVEDPEHAAEIIAKQATKEVPASTGIKGPKAEVRSYDEKEMLRRADMRNAEEKRYLEEFGKSEKEIENGIKEKYGIDGDNWSAVDSESDGIFGTSDLSGRKGEVIEITDGDQTLEVLQDEYMDIMGLSGAIPIDETPFAQAMKTKKPKVEAPKSSNEFLKEKLDSFTTKPKSRDKKIDEALRKQNEGSQSSKEGMVKLDVEPERIARIKDSLSKINKLMETLRKEGSKKSDTPKTPLKSVDPPKPPKGDPIDARLREGEYNDLNKEADQIVEEIDQLNPSDPDYNIMLDKRIRRLEEIKERVGKSIDQKRPKLVDPPKPTKGDPEASSSRFPGIQSQMDVVPTRMDERGRSFGDVGQSEFLPDSRPMPRFEEVPRRNYVESDLGPTATDLRPPPRSGRAFQEIFMDQNKEQIARDEVLEQLLRQEGPAQDAWDLKKQMYKGRPSFEAEQEKFGKVKEAMKGKRAEPIKFRVVKDDGDDVTRYFGTDETLAGMTQEDLQKMVDPTGKRYKVVERHEMPLTDEEYERIFNEKYSKDW